MAVMRTTKSSDKSLAKEFFYLEKLVTPHIKGDLAMKSLLMLLYGFDTGVLHSLKLLESVQVALIKKEKEQLSLQEITLLLKVSSTKPTHFLRNSNSENKKLLV
jgi:hypothetical protein